MLNVIKNIKKLFCFHRYKKTSEFNADMILDSGMSLMSHNKTYVCLKCGKVKISRCNMDNLFIYFWVASGLIAILLQILILMT